ncbi:MAG: FHA domain-containing protein [Deltaproteobacteria bacterium]|nr:FHA domain-containing protein [Deltaproteobacteria bacterium]
MRPPPADPPLADAAHTVPGRLLFAVSHPSRPAKVLGFDQDIIKIGRNANCHLVLDDESVSRMHAVVESRDQAKWIIDLGSSTGTLVNGKKINKAKLSAGDKIRIGAFELVVGIRE